MRITFILAFLSLSPVFLLAQDLTLKGRVLDEKSDDFIEYATISLHNAADSFILDGTISNEVGEYIFTKVKQGQVYVSAQFLGYETFTSSVFSTSDSEVIEDIRLSVNVNTLEEVIVSGRAVTSAYKLDKQVYNAGQYQNARGGSATDVLRNLPSISVNSFGEISVRGNTGFLVMINGKPVQADPMLVLQQLSANAIEDIEIVTAPSAKYDPDGNAGIINIKTKQAINNGLYLVANILGGLPSIEPYNNKNNTQRYGADLTLNYKSGKWDFSTGLDYRRYDISGKREGYVNTYIGDVLTEFPSDGERSFDEVNYSGRASATYTPSSNQSVTAGIFAGKRNKDRTADILYLDQQRSRIPQSDFLTTTSYYDLYRENGTPFNQGEVLNRITFFNENLRIRKSDFFIASLDYNYEFGDQSTLKATALYERTALGGPTDNVSLDYPNTSNILQLQFNENENPLDGIRLQLDYSKNIGEVKFETGYQYRYLQHPGDFQYFDRDLVNNVWVENPLFTNSIDLRRSINSVYAQVSGKNERLEYNAGLRGEYFERSVEIERPDERFELNRFNLFPSANIGYSLTENLTLKAAYSRRIERTTTFKMTPFPEREHSETLEQGDAELLPEYIDQVELGLVNTWGDNNVFVTAYFRQTSNVINRVNTVFNDTILNRIYTNVGLANAIGAEAGTTFYPSEKWRIYLGGNVYSYRIKGALFEENINTSNTVFSINANTNYNFSSTFTGQLAFNYLSERITAQGRDSEFYNPSLTLRKTFSNKKYAIALQWLNIDMGLWNANEQRITTVQDLFFTTTNYVYEVDIIQLNFTYHLNQATRKITLPESEFGKKEF